MVLSQLLVGVSVSKMFQTMYGKMIQTHDVEVHGIQYDSRKVERSDVFVAIKGISVDGHAYIERAIAGGVKVVVMENDAAMPDSFFMHAGVVKIVVADSRKTLALMSANFYGHPSKHLQLVGVTGTNGKTTTTHLMKSILESRGKQVGLIGTIGHQIGEEVLPATHTTPESLELNQLLATMVQKGCAAVVMEVSSHALTLGRVHGLQFAAATFTNLTQDHLDFHGSMQEYFKVKKSLFDNLSSEAHAITNTDDGHGSAMVQDTKAVTTGYGIKSAADFTAHDIRVSVNGTSFTILHDGKSQSVSSSLIGRFNVANILAAYATASVLGIDDKDIAAGIERTKSVRGRFENILSPQGWTAVVDYAHTPDALENCLQAIHDILPAESGGKIITVFGCGGNRDRGKRPQMARIASTLSNVTVVTSDNPRKENAQEIIDEIMTGIQPGARVFAEVDRRKAIKLALGLAGSGDVVLIAGKGHEDYQIIGDTKVPFDDREEVEAFIRNGQ